MGDRNAIDHLLTCPRCGDLCPSDCRYCSECGSRLLMDESYPQAVEIADLLAKPYPDRLESSADAERT